jgi:hypothetical protein
MPGPQKGVSIQVLLTCALWLLVCGCFLFILTQSGEAQQSGNQAAGYRSCGLGKGTCHMSDGEWWKNDPHFKTVNDLKRKEKRSMQIAKAYGMNPADYLKGTSNCAQCHGEVVSGRENSPMNTGVSCESCHGPAGTKEAGYLEVHQEGVNPKDPLDTGRIGYQKALNTGMAELRNVDIRATTCVRCHQIDERILLEAGHPSGEGFDYVDGIRKNISKHWDYQIRSVDIDMASFSRAIARKPIPQFTIKVVDAPVAVTTSPAPVRRVIPDTVYVYLNKSLPPWLAPTDSIRIEPFRPRLTKDSPVDSILIQVKSYIDYIHRQINQRNE